LTEIAIRAGVFLRPGGLRAIEHSPGGYREPISVPIDEFLFLRRIFSFILYPMLSILFFPFLPVPHSEFRPALHKVQCSPAPHGIQNLALNYMGFRVVP
jgi:hypothetical protein